MSRRTLRREMRDPGRALYHLLKADLPGLYTTRLIPDDPQSFVRIPTPFAFSRMTAALATKP